MKLKILKSGNISEETIHITVMEWVRSNQNIKKFILHFPNEGRRTLRFGKLLQGMGMRAGVSDLFIAIQRHGFGGAWIELKSSGGIVSQFQKDFLSDMSQQNYFTAICWSIDEAINTIKWYCFD
jgi:VRR-NUC domain-containing protein